MSLRPSPRVLGYVAAWVGAAVVAVAVGLLAVTSLGASVRDRGQLTTEAVQAAQDDTEGVAVADPDATRRTDTFDGDFGSFEVACQGAVAFGVAAVPASGWRTVSFEEGPDDDVDAVFSSGVRSVELEVFCNGGTPEISDREVKTLPEQDD